MADRGGASGRPRVLVIAHGHPEREPGGAEIAARALHRALLSSGRFDSVFMARHDDPWPLHEGTVFGRGGGPREILFHASMRDRFLFRAAEPSRVWSHFRDALETIRPDVVHFHHYLHLGLETLDEVRRLRPRVPIVMTLHDFHAICHNEGQMIRPGDGALCRRASANDCHGCFPSRSPQDFMLRERHVKNWFDRVDRFVAPSRFLAERYVDWGIEASRIEVLENLIDPDADRDAPGLRPVARAATPPAANVARHVADPTPEAPLRLAYFGRINGTKGIELLLEAVRRLPPPIRARVRLDVHGTGLARQPLTRRAAFALERYRLGETLRFHGAYHPGELPALMREAHWAVVPSRWWENSPLVILEAGRHGLPVICADIGGMAEKIEHGVTGLHFRANDAHALSRRIVEAVELGGRRVEFAERMHRIVDRGAVLARHLALHRELLAPPATGDAAPALAA